MGGKRVPPRGLPDVPLVIPPHVNALLGNEAATLLDALHKPAPSSIRANPLKRAAISGTVVPWCVHGRYLESRPVFTLDPLFHAGAYYVQEASSMLLEQAFRSVNGLPRRSAVLDLCAAPGGKSTHLASLIPPDALLVCNEPVRSRQAALMENLWKWGRANVVVTGAEPEAFAALGPVCDLILVDAPCSGEGMFRKDPHARAQWGENLVEGCALRQQHILDAAWSVLKPGGHLIYSTCTWETSENEDQVQRLAHSGAEVVSIAVDPAWGVQANPHGLRCYPHRVRGEGFFIALLRKPAAGHGINPVSVQPSHGSALPTPVGDWLSTDRDQQVAESDEALYALDACWAPFVDELTRAVHVCAPGIPIALRKGRSWLPHPALALSELLNSGNFPRINLDLQAALGFLRGEALPAADATGTVLVCHQGTPLGWANGAGNRYNNRWPAPWRIRMR